MRELYFSLDVETDGPIPGPHSMLSLGAAAFIPDHPEEDIYVGDFSVNLIELPGSQPHLETKTWWESQPEAWAATQKNRISPESAMTLFTTWIDKVSTTYRGKPVAVAYPATFDFMFVYWYLIKFVGRSPFGFQCLDMKTLAASLLGCPFKKAIKKRFPTHWFVKGTEHTHVAVDDAIEQGHTFVKMWGERKQ